MIDWPRKPGPDHWVWLVVLGLMLLALAAFLTLCSDGPADACPLDWIASTIIHRPA